MVLAIVPQEVVELDLMALRTHSSTELPRRTPPPSPLPSPPSYQPKATRPSARPPPSPAQVGLIPWGRGGRALRRFEARPPSLRALQEQASRVLTSKHRCALAERDP